MRLCAHAQPAHIRLTRRRSALPRPSYSISGEELSNGPFEDNEHGNGNDLLSIGLTRVVPYQLPRSIACAGAVSFIRLFDAAHELARPSCRGSESSLPARVPCQSPLKEARINLAPNTTMQIMPITEPIEGSRPGGLKPGSLCHARL